MNAHPMTTRSSTKAQLQAAAFDRAQLAQRGVWNDFGIVGTITYRNTVTYHNSAGQVLFSKVANDPDSDDSEMDNDPDADMTQGSGTE